MKNKQTRSTKTKAQKPRKDQDQKSLEQRKLARPVQTTRHNKKQSKLTRTRYNLESKINLEGVGLATSKDEAKRKNKQIQTEDTP